MLEFANTYASQLRGIGQDEYGDPVDAGTVSAAHIPACLIERAQQVFDPSTPEPRTIRSITCAVPDWAGFLTTDQLLDETSGDVYMIIEVVKPSTLSFQTGETILTLRRVTAATT